jgi:hypothetical protein
VCRLSDTRTDHQKAIGEFLTAPTVLPISGNRMRHLECSRQYELASRRVRGILRDVFVEPHELIKCRDDFWVRDVLAFSRFCQLYTAHKNRGEFE